MKKFCIGFLLISLVLISFPTQIFADKGDFYDDHKDILDAAPLSDDYIDVIKEYDFETNSFDCGGFGLKINCKMLSFQFSLATSFMSFVADGTEYLILNPEQITEEEGFNKYKGYFGDLSITLLSIFVVYQTLMMVLRRLGDPDDYPQAMNRNILALFGAAILLGIYEPMFDWIMEIQNAAVTGVIDSGVSKEALTLMVFLYSSRYSIFFSIFVGIVMLVFALAIVYRFISIGFAYITGPLAIPTMLNDEFNYFQVWLRFMVNSVVTLFLQSICYGLAMSSITVQFSFLKDLPFGVDVVVGFLFALVICFFALTIPGILGNLGASTGTGRMLGRVTRYAVTKR